MAGEHHAVQTLPIATSQKTRTTAVATVQQLTKLLRNSATTHKNATLYLLTCTKTKAATRNKFLPCAAPAQGGQINKK